MRTLKEYKAIASFVEQHPGAVPQLSAPPKIRFKLRYGSYVEKDLAGLVIAYEGSRKRQARKKKEDDR